MLSLSLNIGVRRNKKTTSIYMSTQEYMISMRIAKYIDSAHCSVNTNFINPGLSLVSILKLLSQPRVLS